MFGRIASITAATILFAGLAAAPAALAQQADGSACSATTWPGLTFGPRVPTYSAMVVGGKCYCGAWTNVSPQQAMMNGWYASCNQGKGICNYSPGTRASNQVCGPFNSGKN